MESIIPQIEELIEKGDATERANIKLSLEKLQLRLESQKDALWNIFNGHMHVASIRLGADLKLFSTLSNESDRVFSARELAEKSGASPGLLERVLRYLASVGTIEEDGVDKFRANATTHLLISPMVEGAVYHLFDTCGPVVQAYPDFMAENGYQDVGTTKTVFQKAHNTELSTFEYLKQQPKLFGAFQNMMSAFKTGDWMSEFNLIDAEARAISADSPQPSEAPFFVDVGGGRGHQCSVLVQKYPQLHGRVVLQDLPETVKELPPLDGVRAMAQDFFQKQVIEGARFYYLRLVLHDWPDALCIQILQKLKDALRDGSKILIDEVVLPDSKMPWQAAMADLMMMIQLGGKERSRKEWNSLVEQAGLRISEVHIYNVESFHSIIVLEAK